MSTSIKQLIGTLFLVAIFGGTYYAVSHLAFFNTTRLTREQVERQITDVDAFVNSQLAELSGIELNGTVFKNAEFMSLVDISRVPERPVRRGTNPFAL